MFIVRWWQTRKSERCRLNCLRACSFCTKMFGFVNEISLISVLHPEPVPMHWRSVVIVPRKMMVTTRYNSEITISYGEMWKTLRKPFLLCEKISFTWTNASDCWPIKKCIENCSRNHLWSFWTIHIWFNMSFCSCRVENNSSKVFWYTSQTK